MAWYIGSKQLSASATATSRYLHEVDLAAAAGNVTLTLPASGADPTYVGVVNASTIANGSKVIIIQTAAAVEVCRLSAAGESVWVGRNPITGAWEQLAHDNPSQYQWTWANAQERNATLASSAQVGRVGYQQDIQLDFQLLAATPRFGPLADPTITQIRYFLGLEQSATLGSGYGLIYAGQSGGSLQARTPTNTSPSLRLIRTGYITAAAAGAALIIRDTNGNGPYCLAGFRARYVTVLVNTAGASANWQWFLGLSRATIAGVVAPSSLFNIFGIGADTGDANVQVMRNDALGVAIKTDLGAGFPARTNAVGYELQIFSDVPGTAWVAQVRNIDSGEEKSFLYATEIPDLLGLMYNSYYANTGGDVVSVGLDFAGFSFGQRMR